MNAVVVERRLPDHVEIGLFRLIPARVILFAEFEDPFRPDLRVMRAVEIAYARFVAVRRIDDLDIFGGCPALRLRKAV